MKYKNDGFGNDQSPINADVNKRIDGLAIGFSDDQKRIQHRIGKRIIRRLTSECITSIDNKLEHMI